MFLLRISAKSAFVSCMLLFIAACGTSEQHLSAVPYPAPAGTSAVAYPGPAARTATAFVPDPPTDTPSLPHTLLNSSPDDIAKLAITVLEKQFKVHGVPTVLLSRLVSSDDIPTLGLDTIPYSAPRPVWVVILKGSFDISQQPYSETATNPITANYILYMFDLCNGGAVVTAPSIDGQEFMTAIKSSTKVPVPPLPPEAVLCAKYGKTVPTIPRPTPTP